MSEFVSVEPILSVRDLREGIAYFVDRLGFTEAWVWGDPEERAGVVRGNVSLHLVEGDRFAPEGPSVVYCLVNGIDEFYAECVRHGAKVIMELEDRPFGVRDFRIMDPSGNRIAFGQALG